MARRYSRGDRSAFFFMGAFEPAELANFNLQNVHLPGDDGILEVLGHGVAIWWGSQLTRDFDGLRDATRDWLETIAAAYYLGTGTALGVRLLHWAEALDVDVKEAVVGFIDDRFRVITAPAEEAPVNKPLRQAVAFAGNLRGQLHLQPAAKEAWRAALDPSDEAFLSAFRALECMRRLYGEGTSSEELRAAWAAMQADLEPATEPYELLGEAAKAVRHGDRPIDRTQEHPINSARERRQELIEYATQIVRMVVSRRADSPHPLLRRGGEVPNPRRAP